MASVSDVMTRNPVCVNPDDLVTHARSVFRKYGFRAMPVVDDRNRIVGIISRGDVMLVTSTKTNLKVSGIMNPNLFSVAPEDGIKYAAQMLSSYGVRQLPVVKSGKVVGIISSMDILKRFFEEDIPPKKEKVADFMSEKVIYCEPDDDLTLIWNKMLVRGFSGLPVVENKVVKGMITRMDVLSHSRALLAKESGKPRGVRVKKIMQTPAITIRPSDKISRAAKLLVENKIIRLPVVDDKHKLIGILDIEDVIRAYLS